MNVNNVNNLNDSNNPASPSYHPGEVHHDGLWARAGNLLLSGWLIVSALAWDPATAARLNALAVGYLVFVFSAVGTLADSVRALNTVLGLWLMVSTWVLPARGAPLRWNTLVIGAGIVALSLVSSRGKVRPPPLRTLFNQLLWSGGR